MKYRILANEEGFRPQERLADGWYTLGETGDPLTPDDGPANPIDTLLYAEAIIGRAATKIGKPE